MTTQAFDAIAHGCARTRSQTLLPLGYDRGAVRYAYVVLRPGGALDLSVMQAWMGESKVAKQCWPERMEILKHLLRKPGDKIQKFKLREMTATEVHHG